MTKVTSFNNSKMNNTRTPIYIALLMCLAIPSVYAGPPVDIQDSDDVLREKIESCINKDEKRGHITHKRARMYRFYINQFPTVESLVTALKDQFLWISLFLKSSFLEDLISFSIYCVCFCVFLSWITNFSIARGEFDKTFTLKQGAGAVCFGFIVGLLQAAVYKVFTNLYGDTIDIDDRYLFYRYLIDNGFCSVKPDNMVLRAIQSIVVFCTKFVAVIVFEVYAIIFMITNLPKIVTNLPKSNGGIVVQSAQ